jgi:hypothetical protein
MNSLGKLSAIAIATSMAACGGSGGDSASPLAAPLTVPKVAKCGASDNSETALQGQVPAALRASGFKGFNCNLKLIGQSRGKGGSWSTATFTDKSFHRCAYYGTQPSAALSAQGVPIVDITNSANPIQTGILNTAGMNIVHEGLRSNVNRGILAAARLSGTAFDLYDVSVDCRSPQLMSTAEFGTGTDGGVMTGVAPGGHEGNFSPDGLTYYVGDTGNATQGNANTGYLAIDISNMAKPRLVSSWILRDAKLDNPLDFSIYSAHGLNVSSDGNRLYASLAAMPKSGDVLRSDAPIANGFVIFDSSEVQARLPNAKLKLIARAAFKDGSTAQHQIPFKVAGKSYLVHVDEGGSAGIFGVTASTASVFSDACTAGLPPFPFARIYSIQDETKPVLISKLLLETHDPKNCDLMKPDLAGQFAFIYGSHYCSVDNRDNATAMACSYFNSGIRVFDIRDPAAPVEIAYFNPPSTPDHGAGSASLAWSPGQPDHCASRLDFDFDRKELVTMCQDNGLLVLGFTGNNNWPFPETTKALLRD